ncbi:hypothetical protein LJK88_42600 [Paenibacillus sp. P26]|nr:hypothetical protein LJK88_42600 [Paenibacillus sp. P26]
MEANQSPGPHTIILPAGTYTLMLAGTGEDNSATGDLDIYTNVTITGAGGNRDGDPSLTIIDGAGVDRVFDINPALDPTGYNVAIEALTIRNGKAQDSIDSIGGESEEIRGTARPSPSITR